MGKPLLELDEAIREGDDDIYTRQLISPINAIHACTMINEDEAFRCQKKYIL